MEILFEVIYFPNMLSFKNINILLTLIESQIWTKFALSSCLMKLL